MNSKAALTAAERLPWVVLVPILHLSGPVTRARAKKFKEALHGLIQEVWAQELMKKPIGDGGPDSLQVINLIKCDRAKD